MNRHIIIWILLSTSFLIVFVSNVPKQADNLQFDHIAKRWVDAGPLGSGMLGVLIWQKDNMLRLSLDRANLWNERKVIDFQLLILNLFAANTDSDKVCIASGKYLNFAR
jgi:alpha-L-fucosidase 2